MPRPQPTTAVLAAMAALCAAPATAASSHAVLPGWWEYTTSSQFSADKTEHRCVKPDEIDKFVAGPSNHHYTCTYPTTELADGRAKYVGVCVSKHGTRYPVRWSGTYDPEHFQLNGTAMPNIIGLSIPVSASITARRLSPICPAS
ncbi:MAG: hypothetical protein INR64_04845 [Caulobacteraceae bacterium]|nr:hypothetical protein [Caulobacter sp.]